MKKGLVILLVIVGALAVIAMGAFNWYRSGYNRLVGVDEQVKQAWGQVETVLQRRFDLVPNLVATVKGYASHEEKVLTEVTNARARVGSAQSVGEKIDANRELGSALSRLLVVTENYPNLKADQGFLGLQTQLEGTENRISVERRRYNEAVTLYNKAVRELILSFIASRMNLQPRPYYEADAAAAAAPKVNF